MGRPIQVVKTDILCKTQPLLTQHKAAMLSPGVRAVLAQKPGLLAGEKLRCSGKAAQGKAETACMSPQFNFFPSGKRYDQFLACDRSRPGRNVGNVEKNSDDPCEGSERHPNATR